MILFIVMAGKVLQCTSALGCVPVPYEAVMELIKLGTLELIMEVGVYQYYTKRVKRKKDDEDR